MSGTEPGRIAGRTTDAGTVDHPQPGPRHDADGVRAVAAADPAGERVGWSLPTRPCGALRRLAGAAIAAVLAAAGAATQAGTPRAVPASAATADRVAGDPSFPPSNGETAAAPASAPATPADAARADGSNDGALLPRPAAPPGHEPVTTMTFRAGGDALAAAPQAGTAQRGLASWYGGRLHGRRTASGERFDMHAMTAAHRTLPMSSEVRVHNPANGRSVTVRINDRGPFHRGRMIDLSRAAALALDVLRGPAMVEMRRVVAPDTGSSATEGGGD